MFKHSRWGKRGMLVHRRHILNADTSWSCNCLYFLPCMLNPIYFKSTFLFLCLSAHIDNRNLHNVYCVSDYCSSVAKLCPTKPNSPGSVCEILQAGILEWVAISFSRGSSQLRDQTHVSCLAGRFFTW